MTKHKKQNAFSVIINHKTGILFFIFGQKNAISNHGMKHDLKIAI